MGPSWLAIQIHRQHSLDVCLYKPFSYTKHIVNKRSDKSLIVTKPGNHWDEMTLNIHSQTSHTISLIHVINKLVKWLCEWNISVCYDQLVVLYQGYTNCIRKTHHYFICKSSNCFFCPVILQCIYTHINVYNPSIMHL